MEVNSVSISHTGVVEEALGLKEAARRVLNPSDPIFSKATISRGVRLNLIGANHLFILDLHWNPQLENLAQDRIYRRGQKKDVYVYKLMAADTIEKQILDLQEKKLGIAQSMLTGTKQAQTSCFNFNLRQKNAVRNSDVHSYDTRHKGDLAERHHRLEVSKRLPMVIVSIQENK
ncbi:hypothetical protein JTB14_026153 [Gonioctena quinquepunctata]|nr:hypothetical protein JTB14_026153 [Gonioctena quinquepunctata]